MSKFFLSRTMGFLLVLGCLFFGVCALLLGGVMAVLAAVDFVTAGVVLGVLYVTWERP